MTPERMSNLAWATLAVGVTLYDILSPKGATMSEAVDRAIDKHPIATIATVGAVSLHLLNVFEHYQLQRYDVLHQLGNVASRGRNEKTAPAIG